MQREGGAYCILWISAEMFTLTLKSFWLCSKLQLKINNITLFITFHFIIINKCAFQFRFSYPPQSVQPVRLLKTYSFEGHAEEELTNLFRKPKLSCTCSNSTSLPTPHPWKRRQWNPPSVQTSPAHASYAQQFFSLNVSNRAAQCQIAWPAAARKQQRGPHA